MFLLESLLPLICASCIVAASSTTSPRHTAYSTSTCPSRTVNYLTHTLPQQCLASLRGGNHDSVSISKHAESSVLPEGVVTTHVERLEPTKSETPNQPVPYGSGISTSIPHDEIKNVSGISVTTVTATSISSTSVLPVLPVIIDEESPLESGNFLSFEDWKKQNLIKAGQSEHIGRNSGNEQREKRKRPSSVQNTLDSLGDDAEIDLDFSGLVPGGPERPSKRSSGHVSPSRQAGEQGDSVSDSTLKARSRSKDAGTTSKERSNYASFDCGANILRSSAKSKNPTSVLVENKDAYMLNECSADNKFLILELCNDISIDTIVLANFEFFSSIFRLFRVSVSDRYPMKQDKWKVINTYEARNTREVQAFLVENPVIWARYLRIEFLSHYGTEYYCPVSLVRVHGTTMMDEYKHDLEMSIGGDEDEDGDDLESQANTQEASVQDTVHEESLSENNALRDQDQDTAIEEVVDVLEPDHVKPDAGKMNMAPEMEEPGLNISRNPAADIVKYMLLPESLATCSPGAVQSHVSERTALKSVPNDQLGHHAYPHNTSSSTPTPNGSPPLSRTHITSTSSTSHRQQNSSNRPTASQTSAPSSKHVPAHTQSASSVTSSKNATIVADRARPSSSTATDRSKQSASATQSHPASPTMQESFFKSVQKRLQMLESNSSLSLQYIEEQSRSLRDAFRKVEQRQLSKTSAFLDHLNFTVLHELREFRQQYDQLWQSTVIELEMQREQYQRENQAMHARLGVLADELIFQKRMSILQMVLILVCLGLVLFSRGVIHNYLELPLVQSVLSKSPSRRWMNLSVETPSDSPQLNRVRSAHELRGQTGSQKAHKRLPSNDSNTAVSEIMESTDMQSPPTPVSYEGFSGSERFKDEDGSDNDLDFDPNAIERPSTSPPVFPSPAEPSTPRLNAVLDGDTIDSRLLSSPSDTTNSDSSPRVRLGALTPNSKHLTWADPGI